MKTDMASKALARLAGNWHWLLVLSVLPLFADNALYNAPLALMALLAIAGLGRRRFEAIGHHGEPLLFFGLLFACLWLPQILALPDAVDRPESLRVALTQLGYGLAAVFIFTRGVATAADLGRLLIGITIVALAWCLDALLALAGLWSVFDYQATPNMVMGLLFNKQSIGHILAAMLPLLLECLRRHARGRFWPWLLVIPVVAVILLSGRRVAWLMMLLSAGGYMLYLGLVVGALRWRSLAALVLLVCAVPVLLYAGYSPFQARVDSSLGVFTGDYEHMDAATSHRIDIWVVATDVARDNWVNGIGPRGFRQVFHDYADPQDNYWINRTVTQPHMHLLEIAAETGVLGLAGYVLFWLLLIRQLRNHPPGSAWALALCLFTAVFPLNAHLAFYSSYWAAFYWWLIGLLFVALKLSTPTTATGGRS